MTTYRNDAVVFHCDGSNLIGIVTVPDLPKNVGVVTIVAGGPQYRVGLGRQLVELSRLLGVHGYSTLRFDYRGMGDSEGDFKCFTGIRDEISAAVKQLKDSVPEVEHVVLWGGCNAASAIMMFAHDIPGVTGMIISNPFVESGILEAKARESHYLSRLKEGYFWKKVLRGGYFRKAMFSEIWQVIKCRLLPASGGNTSIEVRVKPYPERMLEGIKNFSGNCLLVISSDSVDAKRFQVLVDSHKDWTAAITDSQGVRQMILNDADQGFSAQSIRNRLFSDVVDWMDSTFS